MKSFFGWLSSDKEDDFSKEKSKATHQTKNIQEKISNNLISQKASMETEETKTETEIFPEQSEVIMSTYVQKCSKCNLLFFEQSETETEYLCSECIKEFEWVEWNTDEEFSEDNGIICVPTPPPAPEPYILKNFNPVKRCLFPENSEKSNNTLPVIEWDNITSPNGFENINWDSVVSGWSKLSEDCPVVEIVDAKSEDVNDEWEKITAGWNKLSEQYTMNSGWDIEKGHPALDCKNQNDDQNESSEEEYYFPRKLMKSNEDSDNIKMSETQHVIDSIEKLILDIDDLTELNQRDVNQHDDDYDCLPPLEDSYESYSSDTSLTLSDDLTQNENSSEELSGKFSEGTLELIVGPMFSGKSTAALLKLAQMADIGFDVLYVNHADDIRNTEAQDGVVSTHNSQYKSLSKKINSVKVTHLSDVDVEDYQYIGVDEGQFYPDLYENVLEWVTVYGKNVIVASLDGDAYRRKFGQVLDLIPNADSVTKLKAYCDRCRENEKKIRPAPFTARLSTSKDAKVVGGRNLYMAMCRECHDKHLTETAL